MVQSLDIPVLSLAVPNIDKLEVITADSILTMWTVFTKCKDNLENGRRLENLSWRLWYRETIVGQHTGRDAVGKFTTDCLKDHPLQYHRMPSPLSSTCSSSSHTSVFSSRRLSKQLTPDSFKRIITSLPSLIDMPVVAGNASSIPSGAVHGAECSSPVQLKDIDEKPHDEGWHHRHKAEDSILHRAGLGDSSPSPLSDDRDKAKDDDDNNSHHHESNNEGSFEDDKTVKADEEELSLQTIYPCEFQRQALAVQANASRPSLLSTLLAAHHEQQPLTAGARPHVSTITENASSFASEAGTILLASRSTHPSSRVPLQPRSTARHRMCGGDPPLFSEMTVSLKRCVDWERRQNTIPLILCPSKRTGQPIIHAPITDLAASSGTSSTLTPWTELFRGW